MNLSTGGKVTRVMNAVAAGTTAQNSSVIDMAGFDSVTFYALFGAITASAVTSIKVQSGTDASVTDAADLEGTSISVADDDDNQCVLVEVVRPKERYVRLVISRATANAVIDGVIAVQTCAKSKPVTHDSTTVVGSEVHLSPAEGTA